MMPWLLEATRKVRCHAVSGAQSDALVMQLLMMSSLCEKHVPAAPPPQVGTVSDIDVHVSWWRRSPDRVLTLIGEVDGKVALQLNDATVCPVATSHHYDFMPDDLRIALVLLFDGWKPP